MEGKTTIVLISIGSNLGDKIQNLSVAIDNLASKVGKVVKISDFFSSKPIGFTSENNFVNCCCSIDTTLAIKELILTTQEIEIEMGRRKLKINEYEDRIIDIDIIFYGNEIVKESNIKIPHRSFRKRDFVLFPLNQISNHIDPETFISISQFTK